MSKKIQPLSSQIGCTPGPWNRSGWHIVGSDNSIIAKVLPWDISGCKREDQVNANLIAAAPEMWQVIQEALRIVDLWYPHEDVSEEYREEAEVLHIMLSRFEDIARKINQ